MKWRRHKSPRCVVLDQDGKRCRRPGEWRGSYHGDPEARAYYDNAVSWVVIDVCEGHAKQTPGWRRAGGAG